MEQPTRKIRNRIHHQVPTVEVTADDVIMYTSPRGTYWRVVASVTKASVKVTQPKGFKQKTGRVNRGDIKECWRKKVNDEQRAQDPS